jgi:DNA-binding SARP family transcriptional activator
LGGSVQFRILGSIELVDDGNLAIAVSAPRDLAVLGALLVNAGQVVPRKYLIEAIWGQWPPRTARDQLYTSISRLRRLLSGCGVATITTLPTGYRITIGPDNLDWQLFEKAARAARIARDEGRREAAIEHFRQAESMWRGEALEGVSSELLHRTAAALNEERIRALEDCIDLEIDIGRGRDVIAKLSGLVERHPLRERLHGALMRALAQGGRRGEALEVFRRAHRLINDELGIEPSAALTELHRRILRGEEGGNPVRRATAAKPPPSTREAARSTATATSPPQELPADIAGFTARTPQLNELDGLLRAAGPMPAVVMIAGMPGVGKTALAVRWARRISKRFPDGQLFVDLRGFAQQPPTPSVDALAGLLLSLGVPPSSIPPDEISATNLYRTLLAGKRVLVLLDDAYSVEQLRPLLPSSPGSLALVTSRDRLSGLISRHGAHRLTLDVLPAEDARTLLTRLLGGDRIEAEVQAADELAQLCGFLPLALRVTAANLMDRPHHTLAAYVDELRRSQPLADLANDGDDRTSVPMAFNISYRTLPSDAARMFRLVGLVPGPDITPPAAAALADTTHAAAGRMLQRLARAHLISERQPSRYQFHDLVRSYASSLTASEDSERDRRAAIQRLVGWYLAVADAAAATLYPQTLRLPLPQPQDLQSIDVSETGPAREWLETERRNLVAAVPHAAEMGFPALAWHLAFRLRRFFWNAGHAAEWQSVAGVALVAAQADSSLPGQVTARLSLGDLHAVHSRHREATDDYETAAALARRAGWKEAEGAALGAVGSRYLMAGELVQAEEALERRLMLVREGDQPGVLAATLGNLANIYRQQGRLPEAFAYHEQALALYQDMGAVAELAGALSNLGELAHLLGRLDEARQHLTRALTSSREVGSRVAETHALMGLAGVHRDSGRLVDALEAAVDASAMAAQAGGSLVMIAASHALASVHVAAGRGREGTNHFLAALRLAQDVSHVGYQAVSHAGLAEACYLQGETRQARWHAEQAIECSRKSGFRLPEGAALGALATVAESIGDHAAAREHALAAVTEHRATGHRLAQAQALLTLSRSHRATGDSATADGLAREAAELYRAAGTSLPAQLSHRMHDEPADPAQSRDDNP